MKFKFGKRRTAAPYIFLAPNAEDGGEGGGAGTGTGTGTNTTPTPGTGEEDTTGLKSALQKERDRNKKLESDFKALQETIKGIDPAKYAQLEQLQAQAEEWNKKEAGIRAEADELWGKKLTAEQQKTQALETTIVELKKGVQAEKAFQAARGRMEAAEDGASFFQSLYESVGKNLQLNSKGQLEVLDKLGARRFSKKNAAEPMSAAEYFAELAEHPVYGHFFAPSSNAKGGGSNQSRVTTASGEDLSSMPRAARLTLARERGIA